jgi:Uri superfamily endonuclease
MEPPDPDAVTTLPEFIDYLDALSRHFEREKGGADWQHWEIGDYLKAIAAWLRATPISRDAQAELEREIEQERPTWRGVATLFDAGRVYE